MAHLSVRKTKPDNEPLDPGENTTTLYNKTNLKMSSAKLPPFGFGLSVIIVKAHATQVFRNYTLWEYSCPTAGVCSNLKFTIVFDKNYDNYIRTKTAAENVLTLVYVDYTSRINIVICAVIIDAPA